MPTVDCLFHVFIPGYMVPRLFHGAIFKIFEWRSVSVNPHRKHVSGACVVRPENTLVATTTGLQWPMAMPIT